MTTLDQRLRFIDLTFECTQEAERRLIASGAISPHKPFASQLPSPRGIKIAAEMKRIRLQRMAAEGLPLSLAGVAELEDAA